MKFIQSTYATYNKINFSSDDVSWSLIGDDIDKDSSYVCVIGAFDGFHRGHRALIDQASSLAKQAGYKLIVCLFNPDPDLYFNPAASCEELLTAQERVCLIMDCGVDSCLCFDFNERLASMKYQDFLTLLMSIFDLKKLCVGLDFKLGAHGQGSFEKILDFGNSEGFDVVGVDLMMDECGTDHKISSTTIRRCLIDGNIDEANKLLGHMSIIDGIVEHGRGEGTSFGFPTANIMCSKQRVVPKQGVYAAWISDGTTIWPSALNVGLPPTFNTNQDELDKWLLEAFLLDCREDLYDKQLRVFLTHKIGETQKFDSIDTLEKTLRGYIKATDSLLGSQSIPCGLYK